MLVERTRESPLGGFVYDYAFIFWRKRVVCHVVKESRIVIRDIGSRGFSLHYHLLFDAGFAHTRSKRAGIEVEPDRLE